LLEAAYEVRELIGGQAIDAGRSHSTAT